MSTAPRTPKKKRIAEESAPVSRPQRLSAQLQGLRPLKPRTPNQARFLEHIANPKVTVVVGGGISGSGKTLLSLYGALKLIADPLTPYDRLIVFKSMKCLEGEDMGYLPGDVKDKLQYVLHSFFSQLERLLPEGQLENLLKEDTGCVKIFPLGAIRGMSVPPNTIVILDETQNVGADTVHAALTRFEEGAKLICIGDEKQRDHKSKKDNGLTYLFNEIVGCDDEIASVRFTKADCSRKKLIRKLQDIHDAYTDRRDNPSVMQKLLG